MAEIDFKHHVSEIPRGERLPEPIQRKEHVQVSHIPDFQTALSNYGSSTNWMSSLGSKVAASASNEIANRIGGELGKNPQGNISPPITDFDQQLAKSYETQAQSTLGIEAQKLITKSNLELAQQPRLSQDMIAKTQQSTIKGLDNIFSLAPSSIRPQMQSHFSGVLINQNEQLINRMSDEQKKDRLDKLALSNKINSESIYSLSVNGVQLNKNGESIPALSALNATIEAARAAANRHDITMEQAEIYENTAIKSFKSGKLIHEYEKSRINGKENEFLKNLAEDSDKGDPDYLSSTNELMRYVNNQDRLRNSNDQLIMSKFDVDLANNAPITGSQLKELQNNLSPINYQKTYLKFLNHQKEKNNLYHEQVLLSNNGASNPDIWARTSDKAKNEYFDNETRFKMENGGIDIVQAEAMTASELAGPTKVFTDIIKSRLSSTDAKQVEDGVKQLDYLYNAKKGSNLQDVDDRSLSRGALYEVYRKSMLPQDAANLSYDKIYNIKKDDFDILNQQWKTYKNEVLGGINSISYYSKICGIDKSNLTDPLGFQSQADLLYQGYFFSTQGNKEAAEKMFVRDINSYYGETSANGIKQTSYLPLENFVGLPSNSLSLNEDMELPTNLKLVAKEVQFIANRISAKLFNQYSSVGIIQEDIIENIENQLSPIKKLYDQGKSQDYWEFEPRPSLEWAKKNKHADVTYNAVEKYSNGSPMIIHRVYRNGRRDTYELNVKANPFLSSLKNGSYTGGWDVVLRTNDSVGLLNLGSLLSNGNTNIIYRPDIHKIQDKYYKGYANER